LKETGVPEENKYVLIACVLMEAMIVPNSVIDKANVLSTVLGAIHTYK
jgi:hypothetical protein